MPPLANPHGLHGELAVRPDPHLAGGLADIHRAVAHVEADEAADAVCGHIAKEVVGHQACILWDGDPVAHRQGNAAHVAPGLRIERLYFDEVLRRGHLYFYRLRQFRRRFGGLGARGDLGGYLHHPLGPDFHADFAKLIGYGHHGRR